MASIYEQHLDKNTANHVPLSPVSFVERSAEVFGDLPAVIHGQRRYTWAQVRERSARLAAALQSLGVGRGSTVSVMLPNTPEMVEVHYAVPALNAVLNALNTRLDADLIAWQMNHCEAVVLITDTEFSPTMGAALKTLREVHGRQVTVIDVSDSEYTGAGERVGSLNYEEWLAAHPPVAQLQGPTDEWDAIAVWTVAMLGGTHVCLRKVDAPSILQAMREHDVNHYCAAPIVHNLIIQADPALREGVPRGVRGMVAGAAPPAAMIEGMAQIGFDITHVYGLTEVYGPAAGAVKRDAWAQADVSEQARLNGRQGVRYELQEGMTVMDPVTMQEVPADGQTMGEIMFRGNIVMKGYLKNPGATQKAFESGWFHTGDLAVMEPDRYVKIRDRSKDIIISGGENISSLEVEDALYRHPAVMACAVVAKPDAKWGETPLAFVELKAGAAVKAEDLVAHCRSLLAGYKVPREVRFEAIPKTSTGKIQKFVLRERAQSTQAFD